MTTSGHTIAPSHSHGLEIVDQALRAGKVQAATLAFHELTGQTSDPERFGQDLAHVLNGLFDDFVLHSLKLFLDWLRNHPAREMVEAALERSNAPSKELPSGRNCFSRWRANVLRAKSAPRYAPAT
jgi:hypothetical protein